MVRIDASMLIPSRAEKRQIRKAYNRLKIGAMLKKSETPIHIGALTSIVLNKLKENGIDIVGGEMILFRHFFKQYRKKDKKYMIYKTLK